MLNFSKRQINILMLGIVLIALGVTVILLKEYTHGQKINVLPVISDEPKTLSTEEYSLPTQQKLDEIITKKKIEAVKEITIDLTSSESKPKPTTERVPKKKKEEPEEIIIDLDIY